LAGVSEVSKIVSSRPRQRSAGLASVDRLQAQQAYNSHQFAHCARSVPDNLCA
jgi:hypothetical protein